MEKVNQAVLFTNWTDEDFSYNYGGETYIFKAKQSRLMDSYKSEHFADHLAVREMNKLEKSWVRKDNRFMALVQNALGEVVETSSPEKLKDEILNAETKEPSKDALNSETPPDDKPKPFCNQCDSKGGRHKKECPSTK